MLSAQLALFAFDDDLRRTAARWRSGASDDVSGLLEQIGSPPPVYLASAAVYLAGRLAGEERVADVGLHAFASLTVGFAVTGGLKVLTGRARPLHLEVLGADSVWVAHGPGEWGFFDGWREDSRQSWPSAHATAAFTVAALLSEELGGLTPWIAYPLAAGVAWSRVNDEVHWVTDVIMGATVGTFAARLVVRYGHQRGGWLERTLLLEPDTRGGGVLLGVRVPVGSVGSR